MCGLARRGEIKSKLIGILSICKYGMMRGTQGRGVRLGLEVDLVDFCVLSVGSLTYSFLFSKDYLVRV